MPCFNIVAEKKCAVKAVVYDTEIKFNIGVSRDCCHITNTDSNDDATIIIQNNTVSKNARNSYRISIHKS